MNTETKWSFDDQDAWMQFPKCSDKLSPINIITDGVVNCETLCKLAIDYKPGECKITNRNNLVTIDYGKGSKIKFKNELYNLEKITFHTPSLHKINGLSYDLEVCLHHSFGTNEPNDINNGIILCCLFNEGPNSGKCTMFFNDFINDIPTKSNLNQVDVKVWKNWTANLLIPKKKSFFMYEGSLPYPPCTDKYKVLVFNNIETVSKVILEQIIFNIGNNSTKIQPLGNRTIYYNPSSLDRFEEPKSKFDIVKEDKYLRCIKSIKPLPPLQNNNRTKKTKKFIDKNFTKEEENKIRNYTILIIILILFLNCFLIVKWLYKYEHMIKFLNKLGGKITGGTLARKALFNINQMYNQRFN